MTRPSILAHRLLSAAAVVTVLVLLSAGRAAALVPDPGEGSGSTGTTGHRLPAPTTGTSSDLWIALTIGVVALVAAGAVTMLVRHRRSSAHPSPAPASA
jgi:hypothetical protein